MDRRGLFGTYHHGNRMGVTLRQVDYKQDPLPVDRPQVEKDIQAAEQEREFWNGRAAHCRQALELLRHARPQVLPGARDELDYVIFKTENYVTVLDEVGAAYEAQTCVRPCLLAIGAGAIRRSPPAVGPEPSSLGSRQSTGPRGR